MRWQKGGDMLKIKNPVWAELEGIWDWYIYNPYDIRVIMPVWAELKGYRFVESSSSHLSAKMVKTMIECRLHQRPDQGRFMTAICQGGKYKPLKLEEVLDCLKWIKCEKVEVKPEEVRFKYIYGYEDFEVVADYKEFYFIIWKRTKNVFGEEQKIPLSVLIPTPLHLRYILSQFNKILIYASSPENLRRRIKEAVKEYEKMRAREREEMTDAYKDELIKKFV